MSLTYNPDGFWRALMRRPAWHLREYWRNPDYRALHRFSSQLRHLPRHTPATVRRNDRDVELCDGPSFISAWEEIFVRRSYEVPVSPGVRPVLVDAGANIGLAALFWKETYGDFEYLGFEPDPAIAACCRRNLLAWGVEGRLEETALADEEGEASFESDGADGGHLSNASTSARGTIRVKLSRLSRWIPDRVDLLKIDVEGAESAVFREVEPCLGRVRNIFVEWHGHEGQGGLAEMLGRLERAGFDCHVHVAIWQRQPFMRRESAGPSFQNLNIFAVRP